MTDHEMLAFAAKAYGAVWNPGFACFIDPAQPDSMTEGIWLPRTDDGDSFRLMVKLEMNVEYIRQRGEARVISNPANGLAKEHCSRSANLDPAAATREAIFRAAVAIGQAMP